MKRLKKIADYEKYRIMNYYGDYTGVNTPQEAIKLWCEKQNSSPMSVSIVAKSEDSIELLNWAKNNTEELLSILETQHVYKPEKIVEMLDRAHGTNEKYDEYGGDSVYPFDMA